MSGLESGGQPDQQGRPEAQAAPADQSYMEYDSVISDEVVLVSRNIFYNSSDAWSRIYFIIHDQLGHMVGGATVWQRELSRAWDERLRTATAGLEAAVETAEEAK